MLCEVQVDFVQGEGVASVEWCRGRCLVVMVTKKTTPTTPTMAPAVRGLRG